MPALGMASGPMATPGGFTNRGEPSLLVKKFSSRPASGFVLVLQATGSAAW